MGQKSKKGGVPAYEEYAKNAALQQHIRNQGFHEGFKDCEIHFLNQE